MRASKELEVEELPKTYDFRRYLAAKRSVEERALNQQVWKAALAHLRGAGAEGPPRILELGAGIGSMALRLLAAGGITRADFTLVERDPGYLKEAESSLLKWSSSQDLSVEKEATSNFVMLGENTRLSFRLIATDAYRFLEEAAGQWDYLIAHALLDLLDLDRALPQFLTVLRPGGYFYFPINYDGLTLFEPQIDSEFETQLLALYNRSMDERLQEGLPSGDSQTGRHLLSVIPGAGGEMIAAGSSDWLVFPGIESYADDEAYFLLHILHMIESTLAGRPELDAARFQQWLSARRQQVVRNELIYLAHQLDVFGRRDGSWVLSKRQP